MPTTCLIVENTKINWRGQKIIILKLRQPILSIWQVKRKEHEGLKDVRINSTRSIKKISIEKPKTNSKKKGN